MLSRRLQGVLRQYGPQVAFFTTEIVIGRSRYVSWYGGSQPHGMDLAMIEIAAGGQLIGHSGLHVSGLLRLGAIHDFRRYVEEHLARGTWHARWSVETHATPEGGEDSVCTLTPGVLHQTSPVLAIIPWLARTVHHWRLAEQKLQALPQGLTPARERYVSLTRMHAYYKPMLWLVEHVIEVADWANARRPADLMKLSVAQVKARVRSWHRSKEKLEAAAVRPESPLVLETDKYRILRLETKEALEHEGRAMRHCVADYWKDVADQKVRIYTVVEKKTDKSRATIEARVVTRSKLGASHRAAKPKKTWSFALRQVRGFANRKITSKEIAAVIEQLREQENIGRLDDEIMRKLLVGGAIGVGAVLMADLVHRFLMPHLFAQQENVVLRQPELATEQSLAMRLYGPPRDGGM